MHTVKQTSPDSTTSLAAAGVIMFGSLLFISGSNPWVLPWVYVALILVALPMRTLDFVRRKWTFFLLDFCYVSPPLS